MTEPALAVPSRSLHLLGPAWGGLVGAIGLMIGLALEPGPRDVVVGIAFLIGGALAAIRSPRLRLLHALIGAVLGYVLFAVFILLANVISQLGGPDAPEFAESGTREGVVTAIWAVAGCVVGGSLGMRLASSRSRRG